MRLVLIASDRREFRGILSRARDVPCVNSRVRWAREARLHEHTVLLVANGAGPKQAAMAVDAASVFRPDALVSVGFCGAVAPELAPADLLVASQVVGEDDVYPAKPVASQTPHKLGVVRTLDHIAESSMEKAYWYKTGAAAVDMEASAVARSAQDRRLPFYCIKVVTDLAGETLENDLNSALRADGHFDTIKVLGSTLRRPLVRVPELIRLRSRSARAAQVLGEFLADCRF